MRLIEWTRPHELATYFALVFIISWGGVLAVILPTTGFPAPPEAFSTVGVVFAASIFAMLLGPPIAGAALSAFLGGKAALRELRARMVCARVPGRYYALALVAPVSLLGILAALSLFDRAYIPGFLSAAWRGALPDSVYVDRATAPAIVMGFVYAVVAGFLEELGWTGFATPRLIARYGATRAAIVLGLVWTLWHVLPIYAFTAESYGALYYPSFVQSLVFLTSFRVLMTLIYERTGSVLVSQFLHFSLTLSSVVVAPSTTPEQMMIWNSLWPLALALVAVVMVTLRGSTAGWKRQPQAL
jgi:membrane protease YdiL (CAAX protease family)